MVLRFLSFEYRIDALAISQSDAHFLGSHAGFNPLEAGGGGAAYSRCLAGGLVLSGFQQCGNIFVDPASGGNWCAVLVWPLGDRQVEISYRNWSTPSCLGHLWDRTCRPGISTIDDGYLGVREVGGNGVDLVWAPAGPGWPGSGTDWNEAGEVCQFLSADGLTLANSPQNFWRLPTVDEAVRSMTRQGENSGGVWDGEEEAAAYEITPDKESPLWNIHSQVIYWWTATEIDEEHAYIIVYDGKVWPRSKEFGPAYLGFRCVK